MEIIKFENKSTEHHTQRTAVFIFGVGLIGGSIKDLLMRRFKCEVFFCDFVWDPTLEQKLNFDIIIRHVLNMAKTCSIHFVYSAGKSGMMTSNCDLQDVDSFLQVVNIAELSIRHVGRGAITFHLLSSAGGLFEGQLNVDENSIPNPLSHYGVIKLKQENIIENYVGLFNVVIYRPSSVYGFRANARLGLVSTILKRAYKNLFFEVFASKDSIRDYIFIDDISRFIVDEFLRLKSCNGKKVFFLVSGKPTTLSEILDVVSRVTNKRLYYSYRINKENTLDMSFRKTVIPDGLFITPLLQGVLKTKMRI